MLRICRHKGRLWTAHLHGLGDIAKDFDLPKEIAGLIDEVNKYVAAIDGLPKVEKIYQEV